ncbi:hypothetical protein Hanom_Chr05g00459881 [Helianthus anomalus]
MVDVVAGDGDDAVSGNDEVAASLLDTDQTKINHENLIKANRCIRLDSITRLEIIARR